MDLQTQINLMWLMVCTALVFLMQAGFTCLEAGSVRSKNNINVALKNIISFIIAGEMIAVSVTWNVCPVLNRLNARSGNEKSEAPTLLALFRE